MTDVRRALTATLMSLAIVFTTLTTAAAQDKKITLPRREVSAAEVFDAIRQQTDYELSINESRFDLSRRIRIAESPVTVAAALSRLLDGTGMGYIVDGRYIIFPTGVAADDKAKNKTAEKALDEHTQTGAEPDTGGALPEGAKAGQADTTVRQAATSLNGSSGTVSVPSGSDSAKLTAADSSAVSRREPAVTAADDAGITLVTGDGMLALSKTAAQPSVIHSELRTASYNVLQIENYTSKVLSGGPKADIPAGPAFRSNTAGHLPKAAVKTNLLYWGTTTPNLAVELALGPKTTLDLQGSYNPWTFGSKQENKKIQHWMVMPEVRMWVYERFDGHFFGVHPLFISYNVGGVKMPLNIYGDDFHNNHYEGYGVGAGLSYGYQWYLGPHWNLEATFGFGYAYMNYDRYDCGNCGKFRERAHKHYFGPTKIGVSFIYLFRSKK